MPYRRVNYFNVSKSLLKKNSDLHFSTFEVQIFVNHHILMFGLGKECFLYFSQKVKHLLPLIKSWQCSPAYAPFFCMFAIFFSYCIGLTYSILIYFCSFIICFWPFFYQVQPDGFRFLSFSCFLV